MADQPSTAANSSDAVNPTKSEIEAIELGGDLKKSQIGYVAEPWDINSHDKSRAERSLVTKMDLLILPLGALMYLAAYMVRISDILLSLQA